MKAYTTKGALQRHVTACEASYVGHLKKDHERLKARLAKKTAQLNALTHVGTCVQHTNPSTVSLPTLIKRKLNRVDISNIEPFTMELVDRELEKGSYDVWYKSGVRGVYKFLWPLLRPDPHELRMSYACTNVAQLKFYRLNEKQEWEADNGGHFLQQVMQRIGVFGSDKYCPARVIDESESIAALRELFTAMRSQDHGGWGSSWEKVFRKVKRLLAEQLHIS